MSAGTMSRKKDERTKAALKRRQAVRRILEDRRIVRELVYEG